MASADYTPAIDVASPSPLMGQRVALLLAKSSITGAADAEMQQLADHLVASGHAAAAPV